MKIEVIICVIISMQVNAVIKVFRIMKDAVIYLLNSKYLVMLDSLINLLMSGLRTQIKKVFKNEILHQYFVKWKKLNLVKLFFLNDQSELNLTEVIQSKFNLFMKEFIDVQQLIPQQNFIAKK